MPLNKKGKKIMKNMKKEYGEKKGKAVFYAMENSGKLKDVKKASLGLMMGKKLMDKSKEKTGSYMPLGVAGVLEGNRQKLKYMGASNGKSVKGYGSARTSGMGLQDESLVPGKNYEYIKDLI